MMPKRTSLGAIFLPPSQPTIVHPKFTAVAAMANDDPTSLRMGFGYHQARAAGMGGIRTARSSKQVNRLIRANEVTRKATVWLREEVEHDPDWIPFVEHWAKAGLTADEIATSLYNAKFRLWQTARAHTKFFRPPF